MIGLLLRKALDRLRVRLNMCLVINFNYCENCTNFLFNSISWLLIDLLYVAVSQDVILNEHDDDNDKMRVNVLLSAIYWFALLLLTCWFLWIVSVDHWARERDEPQWWDKARPWKHRNWAKPVDIVAAKEFLLLLAIFINCHLSTGPHLVCLYVTETSQCVFQSVFHSVGMSVFILLNTPRRIPVVTKQHQSACNVLLYGGLCK